MKVLHIIKSLGRGGAEVLLQETLKLHNASEFEFHYIYFLPWKNQMVAGIQKEGGIVTNISARNNFFIILKLWKIAKYIKSNKIELIHCHLPWAGIVGRLIKLAIKIPVIYTEHNKQERYHLITRMFNKITFKLNDLVVAVSAEVANSINNNIQLPSNKIKVIPNGVNTNYFCRNHHLGLSNRINNEIPENAIVIGIISVFRSQKRLKNWIDIFSQLKNKYPEVHGCIIGDGILNKEIRNYVNEKGLENSIIMPGLQTDVLPWLSTIDIFLMTSQFEGLPVALLEAMSAECIPVCTDAGGIRGVIRNGIDGFTVPVNDLDALLKPLHFLLSDHSTHAGFRNNSRHRIIDHFSLSVMVSDLELVYKSFRKNQLS
jgi:glycosyltransferase involved in cell wall biosynthesis